MQQLLFIHAIKGDSEKQKTAFKIVNYRESDQEKKQNSGAKNEANNIKSDRFTRSNREKQIAQKMISHLECPNITFAD